MKRALLLALALCACSSPLDFDICPVYEVEYAGSGWEFFLSLDPSEIDDIVGGNQCLVLWVYNTETGFHDRVPLKRRGYRGPVEVDG